MKNGSNETGARAKRFYEAVATEARTDGWRILLDGRVVKTPKRADLLLPTEPLAEAVAAEWRAQGPQIDTASMPLTKLANSTIDAVTPNLAAVAEDAGSFAALILSATAPRRPKASLNARLRVGIRCLPG